MNPLAVIEPIVVCQFDGTGVAFRRSDGWVNATLTAKKFGKETYEFLRLPETKALIAAIERKMNRENPGSSFRAYETVRGRGKVQATWLTPLVGIEFARWLSPDFAVWTNEVIMDILANRTSRLQLAGHSPDEQSAVIALRGPERTYASILCASRKIGCTRFWVTPELAAAKLEQVLGIRLPISALRQALDLHCHERRWIRPARYRSKVREYRIIVPARDERISE